MYYVEFHMLYFIYYLCVSITYTLTLPLEQKINI